ncbi:hypothetical protein Hanom_Chr17g01543011 [Helianthus anomalus]
MFEGFLVGKIVNWRESCCGSACVTVMENPSGNGSDQPDYDGGSLVTEHTSFAENVRDVTLRCRLMFKRYIAKRIKYDHLLTRKDKERKERMNELLASTSYIATQTGLSSYSQRQATNLIRLELNAFGFVALLTWFAVTPMTDEPPI